MNKYIKWSNIIVVTLLSTLGAMEKATTTAFDFVNFNLDARTAGFGGASSLIPAAGTAHWGNPALLAASDKSSFGGSYSAYIADIKYGGGTASFKIKNGLMFAPSFRYLSVGAIEGYDKNGEELDVTIAPFAIDAGIAVSYRFASVLSAGLTVRVANENLISEVEGFDEAFATAMLFDGGIYFNPSRFVSLSAGFRNLGFFINRYDNDESSLPASLYTGIRYGSRGTSRVNALLEVEKQIELPISFAPGLEFLIYKEIVALRVGTNFTSTDMSHFFGIIGGDTEEKHLYSKSNAQIISLGAGFKVPIQDKSIFFDFAANILGDGMGVGFIFSGGFSF